MRCGLCLPEAWCEHARKFLGDNRRQSCVGGDRFPSGQFPLRTRLEETRRAAGEGADEIDMVIDRGAFLSGEYGKFTTRSPP